MGGFCDLHCHILYGVDDGAQTVEDARALIDGAYSSGTRTTPPSARSMPPGRKKPSAPFPPR